MPAGAIPSVMKDYGPRTTGWHKRWSGPVKRLPAGAILMILSVVKIYDPRTTLGRRRGGQAQQEQ